MNDLKTKEELLETFGQKTDIYNNLTYLQDTYEVSTPEPVTAPYYEIANADRPGLLRRSAKHHNGPGGQRKHRQCYGWGPRADRKCRQRVRLRLLRGEERGDA